GAVVLAEDETLSALSWARTTPGISNSRTTGILYILSTDGYERFWRLLNSHGRPPASAGPGSRRSRPGRQLYICNPGQVAFASQQRLLVRSVEIGWVDRASEVGDKHATACQV